VMVPLLAELNNETNAEGRPSRGLEQETLTASLIITADHLARNWPPQKVDSLTESDIQQLLDLNPEVVIIGTGATLEWPDRRLLKPLMEARIGYEIMDTAAACRTYNVLSYEGRKVAAALMMI